MAFLDPIFTKLTPVQWKTWCSVVPNFTQIGQQTWRVRVEVH